jgi:uncharacterized protein
MMRLEYESEQIITANIVDIIRRYVPDSSYKIFFFGSRVSGGGTYNSDIDVGIEGPKPVGVRIMSNIEDDIEELRTMFKIDVVDFANVSEKFKEVVGEQREYI